MNLDRAQLSRYLSQRFGTDVHVHVVQPLGSPAEGGEDAIKAFGYGEPLVVRFQVDGTEQRAVFRTMAANLFGHERRADRAMGMLLSYDSFNRLPRHVRALDVGALAADGSLISLGAGDEFFLLTDYAPGTLYANDLQRLRETGALEERDLRRAEVLAHYLAALHANRRDDAALYRRHLRDVFGSGEGIAGLLDSYPPTGGPVGMEWLQQVERACVAWRWRLKAHTERTAPIHGDFHPYNVLFESDENSFWLLDRSRGPWGEPADDVSCMAINYLFFSLQRAGRMAPPFEQLWTRFWRTYLAESRDDALLRVVQPFMVWRALVLASPTWYHVGDNVRQALFNLIDHMLGERVFDPDAINSYV